MLHSGALILKIPAGQTPQFRMSHHGLIQKNYFDSNGHIFLHGESGRQRPSTAESARCLL
jgi:hypothetical protein